MSAYQIVVLPGDGVGPEIIAEGMKVMWAAMAKAANPGAEFLCLSRRGTIPDEV